MKFVVYRAKKDKLSLYKGQIIQNGADFQAEYLRDYISQVLLTDIKSLPSIFIKCHLKTLPSSQ